MANRLVIFPASKHSEAENYKNVVNSHYAATFEPGAAFAYIRLDAEGQHVVPYYGEPWEFIAGQAFTEPSECEAARVDGVIHDTAIWPDAEE